MALYSLGTVTTGTGIGVAVWEIRSSSTDRARLLKIAHGRTAAPAATYVIRVGRPLTIGVTPTSPVTFIADDPADPAGTVQSALAWGTGPTDPLSYFVGHRQGTAGIFQQIWSFPRGLVIGVSSSIVLWSEAAASNPLDVFAQVDE
jgi:hypothetical protein